MVRVMRSVIIYLLIGFAGLVSIHTRFANPTLTETQLLLEFWDRWLWCLLALIGAVIMIRRRHAER